MLLLLVAAAVYAYNKSCVSAAVIRFVLHNKSSYPLLKGSVPLIKQILV